MSRSSGGWESETREPVRAGSGESCLPGLQTTAFSLWPLMVERERKAGLFPSCKGADPIMLLTAVTSSKPDRLPEAPLPHAIALGFKASAYGFGGTHAFSP